MIAMIKRPYAKTAAPASSSCGDRAVLAVAQHCIHAREINAAHKERDDRVDQVSDQAIRRLR